MTREPEEIFREYCATQGVRMTRVKWNCMRCSTGLCPRSEVWARTIEPCNDCKHYIDKNGETGEVDDGPARETA